MIRSVSPDDAAQICAIYNHYVTSTVVTFEEEAVAVGEMARRIGGVAVKLPWLVDVRDDLITGFAYAAPWHARSAYRHTVETSIYLRPDCTRSGVGSALYVALVARLREMGLHAAIGAIALPNAASVALHEKIGFKPVSHFTEVGRKFGAWLDVGHWQLILDTGSGQAAARLGITQD